MISCPEFRLMSRSISSFFAFSTCSAVISFVISVAHSSIRDLNRATRAVSVSIRDISCWCSWTIAASSSSRLSLFRFQYALISLIIIITFHGKETSFTPTVGICDTSRSLQVELPVTDKYTDFVPSFFHGYDVPHVPIIVDYTAVNCHLVPPSLSE